MLHVVHPSPPPPASGRRVAMVRGHARTIASHPLLTVMAAGIACFGPYCFVGSKHTKQD